MSTKPTYKQHFYASHDVLPRFRVSLKHPKIPSFWVHSDADSSVDMGDFFQTDTFIHCAHIRVTTNLHTDLCKSVDRQINNIILHLYCLFKKLTKLLQNIYQLSDSTHHVHSVLTFLLPVFLILSSPHTTETLPVLSHKHHTVLAESDVWHENLTCIRPPALPHWAARGTPAKHLTEAGQMQTEAFKKSYTDNIYIYRQWWFGII